jgi:head-tail adaptor
MTAVGTYRHRVTLTNPGSPTPDPDGGWSETPVPLIPPEWDCSIQQASARTLESIGAGSVLAQATHLVRGRFHPGITTQTRLAVGGGRVFSVLYVANRDERNIETDLVCAEVVA